MKVCLLNFGRMLGNMANCQDSRYSMLFYQLCYTLLHPPPPIPKLPSPPADQENTCELAAGQECQAAAMFIHDGWLLGPAMH